MASKDLLKCGIPDPKNVMSSWWIKPEKKNGMVVIKQKAGYFLEEEGDIGSRETLRFSMTSDCPKDLNLHIPQKKSNELNLPSIGSPLPV